MRVSVLLVSLLGLAGRAAAQVPPAAAPEFTYVARLDVDASRETLSGELRVTWRVPAGRSRRHLPLVTYAGSLAYEHPALDDVIYPWCFSRGFDAGGCTLGAVTLDDGSPCDVTPDQRRGWPAGTLWWITLPAPIRPGAEVRILVPFRVRVPARFGTFARDGDVLVLNGPTPHVPALAADGSPLPCLPPPARWDVRVQVAGESAAILLNGAYHPWTDTSVRLPAARWLSLVVAPRLYRSAAQDGSAFVEYWRLDRDEEKGRLVATSAAAALRFAAERLGVASAHVVLVEARLRDVFTRHGDGCGFVSDRTLQVFPLLKAHHHGEIATEVCYQALLPVLGPAQPARDLPWAVEAAAWRLRREWDAARGETYALVRDAVAFFSIFPIVDQIRVAPRLPFSDMYFDRPFRVDPLREDVACFASTTPEGRLCAARLGVVLGAAREGPFWDAVLAPPAAGARPALRVALARAGVADADPICESWLVAGAAVNYTVRAVRETPVAGGVRVAVDVARTGGAAALREPVEVALDVSGAGRRVVPLVCDGPVTTGTWDLPAGVSAVEVDPEGRLPETNRADNRSPIRPKLLVNDPRVNFDPNRGRAEAFGSVSLVASGDYRDRLTLGGFLEQEGAGVNLAISHGEGWKRDPTDYPFVATLAAYLERLDENFASTRSGRLNDEGEVLSVRATLRLDTRVDTFNPHSGLTAFCTGEWADGWFGTEFRFRQLEAGFATVTALHREHIVGFEVRFGGSEGRPPTQRLFAAGGEEAVRGIRAGDLLGDYRALLRLEYRHLWLTEVDRVVGLPLLGLGRLRRVQGVAFVDMGNVADRMDDLWHVRDVLMSVGYGLRLYLDAFGARYTMIRLEMAYRIDDLDQAEPLFYLGANHSF